MFAHMNRTAQLSTNYTVSTLKMNTKITYRNYICGSHTNNERLIVPKANPNPLTLYLFFTSEIRMSVKSKSTGIGSEDIQKTT